MVQNGPKRIVVLSGPSGSGKTTLVRELVSRAEVKLVKSVSATTRPPRPAEIYGDDYLFLTDADFRKKLDNGEFLEHAEVFGNFYGT